MTLSNSQLSCTRINTIYSKTFPFQLDEIRRVKLSRVICDNSDKIEDIQVYAMVLPDHEINPRVPCNSNLLPRIDLTRFQGENIFFYGE